MQARVPIVCALIVVAVGVAIYARSFDGPFIYDDIPSIVENPALHQLWPPRYLVDAPPQSTLVSRPQSSGGSSGSWGGGGFGGGGGGGGGSAGFG